MSSIVFELHFICHVCKIARLIASPFKSNSGCPRISQKVSAGYILSFYCYLSLVSCPHPFRKNRVSERGVGTRLTSAVHSIILQAIKNWTWEGLGMRMYSDSQKFSEITHLEKLGNILLKHSDTKTAYVSCWSNESMWQIATDWSDLQCTIQNWVSCCLMFPLTLCGWSMLGSRLLCYRDTLTDTSKGIHRLTPTPGYVVPNRMIKTKRQKSYVISP